MRFMMLMIPNDYAAANADARPSAEAVAEMMKFNAALKEAGALIALDGLHPPATGARVSFSNGQPSVALGPFPGAKEMLGGYWMIDVASRDEAIAWASKCPAADGDMIEIRQVFEMADFPPDVQAAVTL
ncbi:YciI family protein [Alsobacter sp. KACC 23698]|uniref:YciI family protein n=1 Tax=Alsobacter sp. KACC 23698 TaxID=3149229 RepID=A0AAU7JMD4_9HYPH